MHRPTMQPRQFTIASLLWLTFAVACVMGIVRTGWLFTMMIEAMRVVGIIAVAGLGVTYALLLVLMLLTGKVQARTLQPKAPAKVGE